MDGKFCVTQVNKDQIVGQLITNRTNRRTTVSRYRFPIAPKVGDVFKVDMGVGSSFAVTEVLQDERAFVVDVTIVREYKGPIVVPGTSEDEAVEFARDRAEKRSGETLLLLDLNDEEVEVDPTPEFVE